MGNKISIAEARARRTDPVWRRKHKAADLTAIALVTLLLVVPLVAGVLSPPLGLALVIGASVVAAAALGCGGPTVGFERRTAVLAIVPVLNLPVLVPAVWRAAHLHLQRWQGPLQPGWDDTVWLAAAALSTLAWVAILAGVLL